jgi:hypothetical protein
VALRPDLQGSLVADGHGEQAIDHPLLYWPGYTPDHDEAANEAYASKLEEAKFLRELQEWMSYIDVHSERHRLRVWSDLAPELNDEQYASLLAHTWCESNHVYLAEPDVLARLLARPPATEYLMNPDEREAFAALPEEIPVFRGYGADRPGRRLGMSWSSDNGEAMRMAYDYHGDDPCVVTGRCHKADVLAYFLRRKEFEILIDPQRVEVLSEPENERLPERG